MFLINYVTPDKAEGSIADVYNFFPKEMGVPESLQIFSANPKLLELQGEIIKYYVGEDELSFHLLAAIRFIAANHYCHDYCTLLNANMLKASGLTEEEVQRLMEDPTAGFEKEEAALISFVAKSLESPTTINEEDIAVLRNYGWSDKAIFAAIGQAAQMSSASLIYKTFKK